MKNGQNPTWELQKKFIRLSFGVKHYSHLLFYLMAMLWGVRLLYQLYIGGLSYVSTYGSDVFLSIITVIILLTLSSFLETMNTKSEIDNARRELIEFKKSCYAQNADDDDTDNN